MMNADPRSFRPTEINALPGDSSKVKERLGWIPEINLKEMYRQMLAADLREARRQLLLEANRYAVNVSAEARETCQLDSTDTYTNEN
jgi:GDPmannose 4,6-dehydratase